MKLVPAYDYTDLEKTTQIFQGRHFCDALPLKRLREDKLW